jgi:FAD synthase
VEYYFETTPYIAQLGKQLLVASDSTCTEYHKAKVKQKIGKDKIKIEFTHKVRISAGMEFCMAKCCTLFC